MSDLKNLIAHILIEIEAVIIDPDKPFTYASGLKGPIYCDNRKLLSHVHQREEVIKGLITKLQDFNYDLLAGVATAGIAPCAFMAEKLKAPMIYIRPRPKAHGRQNQIEGDWSKGQSIILIEDLVNQGKSINEAIECAKEAGLKVVACLCIVDYQMNKSKEIFKKLGIPLISLTDFDSLINVYQINKQLSPEQITILLNWHNT